MKTDKGPGLLKDEAAFDQWKRTLQVPKKAAEYSVPIEQYIRLREDRQNNEKYKLIEFLPYDIKMQLAEKLKLKKTVSEERTLAIEVSDKELRRACLFMNYLMEKLKELGARVEVDQYEIRRDNTVIKWEGVTLFCHLTEQTTRYRNCAVVPTGDMTPPYEEIPTGELILTFSDEKKTAISFADDGDKRIENQIQDIFTGFRTYVLQLKKLVDEEKEKEHQKWAAEQKRWELRRAAEEAEKERNKLREYKQQIYGLMTAWEQGKRAKEYVGELNSNLGTLPEEQQEKVNEYCKLVLQLYTVENQYQDILDFMRNRT